MSENTLINRICSLLLWPAVILSAVAAREGIVEVCSSKVAISESTATSLSETTEWLKDTSGVTRDFLMGKFDYRKHQQFEKVPASMSSKDMYIQKAALKSFTDMQIAAKKNNINLTIISGTRSFHEQKAIWERKWDKEAKKLKNPKDIALKILMFSSMPSTSRHHWGTDIDINSLEPAYFQSGKGMKEYKWLKSNGPKYGFYQVYTSKKNGRTGYAEEPWHWSYLPLANHFLNTYNKMIKLDDIRGFKGAETAKTIDVIKFYVNGIEKNK